MTGAQAAASRFLTGLRIWNAGCAAPRLRGAPRTVLGRWTCWTCWTYWTDGNYCTTDQTNAAEPLTPAVSVAVTVTV
ncbi:MAG TPA: hypothetical protein VFN97_04310 [Actinospica sp.]|nr:hypothetical protein [Actinospica sp.]